MQLVFTDPAWLLLIAPALLVVLLGWLAAARLLPRARRAASLVIRIVLVVALGMVLAGRLTEAVGPRWVWGGAAILSTVAAAVGFTLARGAAETPLQAAEPAQSPVEPEPAIEAHGGARQRAV